MEADCVQVGRPTEGRQPRRAPTRSRHNVNTSWTDLRFGLPNPAIKVDGL